MSIATITPDWDTLSPLLDEALEQPVQQRSAWLAGLGTRASATQREVLARLLALQPGVETGGFLEQLPALPADASFAVSSAAPRMLVGPYRLVEEIGQGGMSTVWRAERADYAPRREVALKLPLLTWGGRFAERLSRERDIVAALEHPNIARFLDAGLDEAGRPWLATELIEGEPIDAYCARHGVDLRGRMELVLQVCDAVAHAHARLVIHRDLKPANILVTPEGAVKLLDFGIAKLLQGQHAPETALTQAAGRALTPDFASPEQIRGEPLSTASDVYAIGVVAYLLATGERPYRLRRGSAAELEEAIAHALPPRASDAAKGGETRRQLRGDLDAILAKALSKDVASRYVGAGELAQDLRRHFAGLPIEARPQGRLERMRHFAWRHKAAVGMLAVVVSALGAGLGVATWQATVARQQEGLAHKAVERERAVQDMLIEILSVAVTADPERLKETGAFGILLEEKFDQLERRFRDRPDEWLDLLEAISTRLPNYGDYVCSYAVGQRYLALLRATKADELRIARAALVNASALAHLNHRPKAAAALREALRALPDRPGALPLRKEMMATLAAWGD
jgi:serine/threonine-protein kinase